MAQGIFGGATSYEEQSLTDIDLDIQKWIKYTEEIKKMMNSWLEESKRNGFWEKVDFDFQMTIYSSISYYNTIISDMKMVHEAILYGTITQREVKLLQKIGNKAFSYNNEYPQTYKSERRYWHDYGNPQFQIVENMYAKGRDYFVTLQDAANAAARLEDYMSSQNVSNNTMNISGDVIGSQIQQGTVSSTQNMQENKEFDYDKVLEVLKKIEQYSNSNLFEEEFGDKAEEVRVIISEAIDDTAKHKEPFKIKRNFSKIKQLAEGVTTGIIASGIVELIKQIPNLF